MYDHYPRWFDHYLFDEKKYRETDTITFLMSSYLGCNNLHNDRLFSIHCGNSLPDSARAWELIDKQHELINKYFAFIRLNGSSHKYRYHSLGLDITQTDTLPNYMEVTVNQEAHYRSATLKIKNAAKFIHSYNCMLREYLTWCMENHKCCENNLFLTDIYGLFTTDREKEEQQRKHEQELAKRRHKEELKIASVKAQIEEAYNNGTLEIQITNMHAVYDDYYFLCFSVWFKDIEGMGSNSFQLHKSKLYYGTSVWKILLELNNKAITKAVWKKVILACRDAYIEKKATYLNGNRIALSLLENNNRISAVVTYDIISDDFSIKLKEK